MSDLPNTLALTTIADGSARIASPVRNNFADVAVAVNALKDALAGGVSGQIFSAVDADTVHWVYAGGMYRKTTSKTVNNTVAETDLLNGEITIGAGVLGTTGRLRCSFDTDLLANSGAPATWKFKVKLGGTTVFDTGALTVANQGANRTGWSIDFSLMNNGAAALNTCKLRVEIPAVALATTTAPVMTAVGTGEKWTIVDETTATTIDTATSKLLEVTVTHGTAAATIETKLYSAVVEVI